MKQYITEFLMHPTDRLHISQSKKELVVNWQLINYGKNPSLNADLYGIFIHKSRKIIKIIQKWPLR